MNGTESTSSSQPKPTREASVALLYLLVLIVGSAAALTEILPRRTASGDMSNSGGTGIFWSSLLFLLAAAAFLRAGWKVWWGKIMFLLIMIFWCHYLFREIGAQLLRSMFHSLN